MNDACPTDQEVAVYLGGDGPVAERELVQVHVDGCESCRELLVELVRAAGTRSTAALPSAPVHVAVGEQVDRYTVVAKLGAGGMGTVYLAHDPQLERDVALKVLHRRTGLEGARRKNMLREARALAKLADPHIVHVYDAGETEAGDAFIAMEYVHGETLDRWLESGERSWREVAAVFRQAAKGLVGAHEAGIVHRDFKPANVLVGDDGRVRVTDLGLARAVRLDDAGPAQATRFAAGTPVYMSPEQRRGEPVDPRSDQYSYCVSLHEAVFGSRPDGPAASGGRGAPGWLRRLIVRGLNQRPDERFRDMKALTAALDRGLRRRQRIAIAAVATALVVAAPVAWVTASAGSGLEDRCSAASASLAETWSPQTLSAAEAAFSRSGPAGASAWQRTRTQLNAYRGELATMYVDSCEATHIHNQQSDALLDRRGRCLNERREQLAALLTVFGTADQLVVRRAEGAAGALPRVSECADAQLLSDHPIPSEEARAAVAAVDAEIAAAQATFDAGQFSRVKPLAERALGRARELGFEPTLARALLVLGTLELERGDAAAAEPPLNEALDLAEANHLDLLAVQTWISLSYIPAVAQGGYERSDLLHPRARAAVKRIGDDPYYLAQLQNTFGIVAYRRGNSVQALAHWQASLKTAQETPQPNYFHLVLTLNSLAIIALEAGELGRAREMFERSATVASAELGPRHPNSAYGPLNVAEVDYQLGDYAAARTSLARALKIFDGLRENDHPHMVGLQISLADVEARTGARAEGSKRLQSVARHVEPTSKAAQHRQLWLSTTALVHTLSGEPTEAKASLEQMRDQQAVPGRAALGLAQYYLDAGDASSALEELERAVPALAGKERTLSTIDTLATLGRARQAAGQMQRSIAPLERALETAKQGAVNRYHLATAQVLLARALRVQGDSSRADALAAKGRAILETEHARLAGYSLARLAEVAK